MTVTTATGWESATPSGTTLTNSNSGAAATVIGTGCTAVSSSTSPLYGSLCATFAVPATNVGNIQRFTISGGTTTMAFSIPFRIDALPSTGKKRIWSPRYASGYVFNLAAQSDGTLQVADQAGANFLTTTETVTVGQWYRAEILIVVGATTSTGTVSCNFYLDDTTTRFNATTLSSSSYNLGTAAVAAMDVGSIQNGVSASMTISFDDIRYEIGGTTEIGPETPPTLTIDPAKVCVIGDSLTANMPAGVLQSALEGAGWASGDIYIDGLSGREVWGTSAGGTTPDTQSAIDTMRGTSFEPGTWIIALGTNDATGTLAFCSPLWDSLLQYIGPDHTVHIIGTGYQTEADCAPGYDGTQAAGSRWSKVGAASGSNAAIQNLIDTGLDPATYPTTYFWNWNDWSQLVAHRTDDIWSATDTGAPSGNARHMNSTGYTDYRAPYYALASLGYGCYLGVSGAWVKVVPYLGVSSAWVACNVSG